MGRVIRTGPLPVVQAALGGLDGLQGKVGWNESAKYPDGTPVAYVASIHEFGAASQGIPARPFMRPAIAKNQKSWAAAFGKGAAAVLKGNFTPREVMERVCMDAVGAVKSSIASVQSPALEQSTVDARRRAMADGKTIGNLTKPLVASGLMVNSVDYEVTTK